MSFLTGFKLNFNDKLLRHRIIFPVPSDSQPKEEKKEIITFEPNETVCFVRYAYARKKFSPTVLYIVRTVSPGEEASLIEGVMPGAKILLRVLGEKKIKRTLILLEDLKKSGIDLQNLSDSVLQAIHSRNEANMSLEFLAERVIEGSKIQ